MWIVETVKAHPFLSQEHPMCSVRKLADLIVFPDWGKPFTTFIEGEDSIFQEKPRVWGKIWTQGHPSTRGLYSYMNRKVGQTKDIRNESIHLSLPQVVQDIRLHVNKCKRVTGYRQRSKAQDWKGTQAHSVLLWLTQMIVFIYSFLPSTTESTTWKCLLGPIHKINLCVKTFGFCLWGL